VRRAKRLTTVIEEKPRAREKALQRRIVGSSHRASAVLGLSMIQRMPRDASPHARPSVYRYWPQRLKRAVPRTPVVSDT
jgi:hypothetical protein